MCAHAHTEDDGSVAAAVARHSAWRVRLVEALDAERATGFLVVVRSRIAQLGRSLARLSVEDAAAACSIVAAHCGVHPARVAATGEWERAATEFAVRGTGLLLSVPVPVPVPPLRTGQWQANGCAGFVCDLPVCSDQGLRVALRLAWLVCRRSAAGVPPDVAAVVAGFLTPQPVAGLVGGCVVVGTAFAAGRPWVAALAGLACALGLPWPAPAATAPAAPVVDCSLHALCAHRLAVPFSERDRAKAAGARWDGERRCWYVAAPASDAALVDGLFPAWRTGVCGAPSALPAGSLSVARAVKRMRAA